MKIKPMSTSATLVCAFALAANAKRTTKVDRTVVAILRLVFTFSTPSRRDLSNNAASVRLINLVPHSADL